MSGTHRNSFAALRYGLGLSVIEAAKALGVDKRTVGRWEQGVFNTPQEALDSMESFARMHEQMAAEVAGAPEGDEGVVDVFIAGEPGVKQSVPYVVYLSAQREGVVRLAAQGRAFRVHVAGDNR